MRSLECKPPEKRRTKTYDFDDDELLFGTITWLSASTSFFLTNRRFYVHSYIAIFQAYLTSIGLYIIGRFNDLYDSKFGIRTVVTSHLDPNTYHSIQLWRGSGVQRMLEGSDFTNYTSRIYSICFKTFIASSKA
jgi:hypothetical protein